MRNFSGRRPNFRWVNQIHRLKPARGKERRKREEGGRKGMEEGGEGGEKEEEGRGNVGNLKIATSQYRSVELTITSNHSQLVIHESH